MRRGGYGGVSGVRGAVGSRLGWRRGGAGPCIRGSGGSLLGEDRGDNE
jgi:hypothetical protein